MKNVRGNSLALFVVLLLVVMMFFPLVIQLLQSESKQSVNYLKSALAFQVAESAVVKGVAKLSENRSNWLNAAAGIPIDGYRDDRVYADLNGGSYKVAFHVGSTPGSVLVVGKGRDDSTKEVRVIEAEYAPYAPDTALIFNKGFTGNDDNGDLIEAHWGAVRSYGNSIYRLEKAFPRLYSSGSTKRDADPTLPNTNNVDNWSFQTDMGAAPFPDLAYYKTKAMNSFVPTTTPTGEIRRNDAAAVVRNPPNSGYFQESLNPSKQIFFDKQAALPEGLGNLYEYKSSTSVIYIESNEFTSTVQFQRVFLDVEAVILGKGTFSLSNSTVTFKVFGATIPAAAQGHYMGTTVWQAGFPTAASVWSSDFAADFAKPNHCCHNIPNVQIHGYLYAYRHDWGKSSKVVGVAHSGSSSDMYRDNEKVYFDPEVLKNVVWATSPIHLLSWKETGRDW